MRPAAALLCLCAVLWPGFGAAGDAFYDSSLLSLVDQVARALEARVSESDSTRVELEVRGGRGVADRKAARVFRPRLERRLADRGSVSVGRGGVKATLELSIEGPTLWVVGVLEGGGLPGASAVAVRISVDRELETVLGASSARTGQARWVMERLGTVPAGVLDADLLDVDRDGADEVVLLSVDGVRTLQLAPGDPRPKLLGGPWPLPGGGSWPRLVAGWVAAEGRSVQVATTAGHSARLDPVRGTWKAQAETGVPLKQPPDPAHEAVLRVPRIGRGVDLDGSLLAQEIPAGVRDAIRFPGLDDCWLWVDSSGFLGAWLPTVGETTLPEGRFGDRIVVADLDANGQVDLVTSDASAPGEPDQVTIHRIASDLTEHGVLFRSSLGGGSVVALAAGDLDFDGNLDLVVVEEGVGPEALLWRIELGR